MDNCCPNCDNPTNYFLCNSCMESGNVLAYNYRPKHWPVGGTIPRLGVELEFSTPDRGTRYVVATNLYRSAMPKNLFYLKHDGSIPPRGSGFEVVSCPMGMELHEKWWKVILDNLKGASVNSLAGLHIHMERLPPLSQGKLVELVSSEKFFPLLWFVAGRTPPESHATLLKRDIFMGRMKAERMRWFEKQSTIVKRQKASALVKHLGESKYEAVNIAGETLELRFFASTLDYETLMTRLEVGMWFRKYIMCTSRAHLYDNFISSSLNCPFKRVRRLMRKGGF